MKAHARAVHDDVTAAQWVLAILMGLFVGACMLTAVAIPAWQAYAWLRYGVWHPVSIVDGLRVLASFFAAAGLDVSGFQSWLEAPGSWFGLHKLLSMLHASVGLWAGAFGGAYSVLEIGREARRSR